MGHQNSECDSNSEFDQECDEHHKYHAHNVSANWLQLLLSDEQNERIPNSG